MTNEEKIKLLRERLNLKLLGRETCECQECVDDRKAIAVTSPAQPEPAQRDERAEFEEWFQRNYPKDWTDFVRNRQARSAIKARKDGK